MLSRESFVKQVVKQMYEEDIDYWKDYDPADPFKDRRFLKPWQLNQPPHGTIIKRGDRAHSLHPSYDPRAFYNVPTLLKYDDRPRVIRSDFLNVRRIRYVDPRESPVAKRTPSLEEIVHDPDCVDVLCPGERCFIKGHHGMCMNVLCMGGYKCFEEIENQERTAEADREREFLKSLPNPYKAFKVGGWYQDPIGMHDEAKSNLLIQMVLQNYGLLNAFQIYYKLDADHEKNPNPFTSVDELKEYLDLRPFIFYRGPYMKGYMNTGYGYRCAFENIAWFIYNCNKKGEACLLQDVWEKVVKNQCMPLDPAAIVRNKQRYTDSEFTVQSISMTRFIEMFVLQMSNLFTFKGEGDNVAAMLKMEAMSVLSLFFSAALPYDKQFLEASDVSRREQLVVKIENADRVCADGYVLHGNFHHASVRISAFRCKLRLLPSSVYVGNIVRVVAFRIFRGTYEFEGVSVCEFDPGWRKNRSTYIEEDESMDELVEDDVVDITEIFPNYGNQQELSQDERYELNKLFNKEDAKRRFADSLFPPQHNNCPIGCSSTRMNLERRYKASQYKNNPFASMEECCEYIHNRTYLYNPYLQLEVKKIGPKMRALMEECLEIISRFPEGVSPNQLKHMILTIPKFCSDELQSATHFGDLDRHLLEVCDYCIISDADPLDDPDDRVFTLNGTYFLEHGFLPQKYKDIIRAA